MDPILEILAGAEEEGRQEMTARATSILVPPYKNGGTGSSHPLQSAVLFPTNIPSRPFSKKTRLARKHDAFVTDDSIDLHSSIHPHSPRADLIRSASAIVCDKLPTINRAAWESVDELCRIICNRPRIPFWGKTFIGLGEAGPVISGAGETATLAASVKLSTLWQTI
ncbi:uncharacterized protein F5147DRAFT_839679 [Suillus discolor]|uniref:ATP-dependent DNA helicase n=1 Tax=Suillus discolor TaxID=1912936 RepID=A0A9P7EYQ7_9AGAM|nr:uncharacterized protein F5147DRAFT_839679 [Suillus discolor]KAG2098261.1 hypothetical protein F5147DRAFT_839679 [Suillus discolor]